jgi:hypothetical protein
MSALKKTTREEQGWVYVGVGALPTPPHISVLVSQLTFFSGFSKEISCCRLSNLSR